MIQQSQPVVPPQSGDRTLRDFSQIIQGNIQALFQAGHIHKIVTENPSIKTGSIGDIYLIDGVTKSIAIKFSSGWYAISLTAI